MAKPGVWKPHLYACVVLCRMRRVPKPVLLLLAVAVVPGCALEAGVIRIGGPPAASGDAMLPAPRYCTRSLAVVDCWKNPAALNGQPQHPVADGPDRLTPAQQAAPQRGWP